MQVFKFFLCCIISQEAILQESKSNEEKDTKSATRDPTQKRSRRNSKDDGEGKPQDDCEKGA